MKEVNTEEIIGSLFVIGFDRIDSILYTYTLGKMVIDNQEMKKFSFKDVKLSTIFNKYVEYSCLGFKLKEDYSLETDISPIEGYSYTLRSFFGRNKELVKYLSSDYFNLMFDESEVVRKMVK